MPSLSVCSSTSTSARLSPPGRAPTCSGAALGDPGSYVGGPNAGQACVVEGVYGPLGNTSASCPPPAGSRIATIIPNITGASTGAHALPATFPCEGFGAGGLLCHCDGQVLPNSCDNSTCGASESCTDNGSRRCFPDPIVRNGSTTPLTVSAVGCATTSSPVVQTIVGLPGPIAVDFDLDVTLVP